MLMILIVSGLPLGRPLTRKKNHWVLPLVFMSFCRSKSYSEAPTYIYIVHYFESAKEVSRLEFRVEGTRLLDKAVVCKGGTRTEVFQIFFLKARGIYKYRREVLSTANPVCSKPNFFLVNCFAVLIVPREARLAAFVFIRLFVF